MRLNQWGFMDGFGAQNFRDLGTQNISYLAMSPTLSDKSEFGKQLGLWDSSGFVPGNRSDRNAEGKSHFLLGKAQRFSKINHCLTNRGQILIVLLRACHPLLIVADIAHFFHRGIDRSYYRGNIVARKEVSVNAQAPPDPQRP